MNWRGWSIIVNLKGLRKKWKWPVSKNYTRIRLERERERDTTINLSSDGRDWNRGPLDYNKRYWFSKLAQWHFIITGNSEIFQLKCSTLYFRNISGSLHTGNLKAKQKCTKVTERLSGSKHERSSDINDNYASCLVDILAPIQICNTPVSTEAMLLYTGLQRN